MIFCHKSKKELKNTNIIEYIKWGEKQKYNLRPSVQAKDTLVLSW